MVTDDGTAKLGNVVLKVYQVFGLLVGNHIIKMDVLVTPLKVVDNPLVCQLLLHYKQVLEEVDDALVNIEVIKLSNHCLLVLEVLLVSIDKCIPLINDTPNVVEHLGIGISLQI